MTIHAPIVNLSPQVRDAFNEGCRAVFQTSEQRAWAGRETRDCLLGFAAHYQRLIALPRRTRRSIERRWKRTLSAIALLMTLGLAPASAAVIEVSPGTPPAINADGKCSLIEAIINANRNARTHLDCAAGAGPDTIVLPAKSTQQLGASEILPQITSRIVIEGHHSTISRNTYTRLYFFSVSSNGDLTLNETTITGATTSFTSRGYGVSSTGHLALNDSSIADTGGLLNRGGVVVLKNSRVTGTLSRPYVYAGSGIQNRYGGTLTVTNSVISGNTAVSRGGGVYNSEDSTATLTDSIVSENRVLSYQGSGGGIHNNGSLVLMGTSVADNHAHFGGGIVNLGTATVRRSTISGNRLDSGYGYSLEGGGINNGGKLTLVNSTVSNNEARTYGGGVNSFDGTLTILSSTVTGNTLVAASPYLQQGSGVNVRYGTLTLQRSIVSGNTANTAREIFVDSRVVVKANDFNIFGFEGEAGVAGFTPGSTDIVPNDPIGGILLPLADNGGGTKTHALAIGSPALDASPDDATCPATDQRGNPRPRGPACDIGAFEGVAVVCNGKVTTMVGTINDDHLTGTAGPDVISGLLGNDTVTGLGGNDLVCAGSGADVVYGGPGADLLFGEPGNDRLFGQGGNDTLNGGVGQDVCDGGAAAGDTASACENVSGVP